MSLGTINEQGLVDEILKRGSTLTRPDILAVLAVPLHERRDVYQDTIIDRLQAGYRVNTRLINFGLSIQGTFNGTDDSFDSGRHTLNITTTATTVARQTLRTGAQMKKGEAQIVMPNPEAYAAALPSLTLAAKTPIGCSRACLPASTPNNPGQLTGRRLKFDADDEAQGVFFIASDGTATRASLIMRNKPAELIPQGEATRTVYGARWFGGG